MALAPPSKSADAKNSKNKGSRSSRPGLFAVLTYPESEEKQEKFIIAAGDCLNRRAVNQGLMTRGQVSFGGRKKETAISTVRAGVKRIQKERMQAAYFAIAYIRNRQDTDSDWSTSAEFYDDISGDFIKRKTDSRIFATEKFYQLLYNEDLVKDTALSFDALKKADERAWQATKPVLHLMLALPLGLAQDDSRPILNLMGDSSWVALSLAIADAWRISLPFIFPDMKESESIQVILV